MQFKEAVSGFVAEVDGYLCFIIPAVDGGQLVFNWSVQSGGGWTFRGGRNITKHAMGQALTVSHAIDSIAGALLDLGVELEGADLARADW